MRFGPQQIIDDAAGRFDESRHETRRVYLWKIISIAVLVEAAILRIYALTLRPIHFDEGVNGYFLVRLFRYNDYQYNPANFHGPALYYAGLISAYLFGLNTVAIRIVPAVFGIGTVWLVLRLKRRIGIISSLIATILLCVSPGAVYFSRYFIHESLFVFFTLWLIHTTFLYRETRKTVHFAYAAAACAFMFATKETTVLALPILAGSYLLTLLITYWRTRKPAAENPDLATVSPENQSPGFSKTTGGWISALNRWARSPGISILTFITGAAVFYLISITFFSSFYSNRNGILDAFKALRIWAGTGRSAHFHVWYTYLWWLLREEAPILILGFAGMVISLKRGANRFSHFCSIWCFGTLMTYSIIPYKTPWLILNMILPLSILSGIAAGALLKSIKKPVLRLAALFLVLGAIGFSTYNMIDLNFYHYDDDSYAYVYAHTRREVKSLLGKVTNIARGTGEETDTTITVMAPDYWPLPWYFRNFKTVGYPGQVCKSNDAVVIGSTDQDSEIEVTLADTHTRIGTYVLRPGIELVLYVRKDISVQ